MTSLLAHCLLSILHVLWGNISMLFYFILNRVEYFNTIYKAAHFSMQSSQEHSIGICWDMGYCSANFLWAIFFFNAMKRIPLKGTDKYMCVVYILLWFTYFVAKNIQSLYPTFRFRLGSRSSCRVQLLCVAHLFLCVKIFFF